MNPWKDKITSDGWWWVLFPDGDRVIGAAFCSKQKQPTDVWDADAVEISFGYGMHSIDIPAEKFRKDGCVFQKVKEPDGTQKASCP